jgi:predicted acyl esterase
MVPMTDGVRLATDVYLPGDGKGTYPVILSRGPYGKEGAKAQADQACQHGYAYISQDIRGRGKSEGHNAIIFHHDGWAKDHDGHDTIRWIAKQSWCNGKIGSIGGSALGITQNMTAPGAPEALQSQVVHVAFSNMYSQGAYQGGAFRQSLLEGWLKGTGMTDVNLATFVAHPRYDSFWDELNPEAQARRVNAPGVFLGGWYDIFVQGTINSFVTIQNEGGPKARGRCRLIIGPYAHGTFSELKYPTNSGLLPKAADPFVWFDYTLKGQTNEVAREKPVHYYVMGDPTDKTAPGNFWRSADRWPPPAAATPFYFHPDGQLVVNARPTGAASKTYKYDPKNPVPTVGGQELLLPKGPLDQRKIESRPDILLFTTDALTEPVEVTGRITAKLFVSSDSPDTDFTVKLCDVYPDGRSMLVTDGILRARYRKSFEHEDFLEPGKVYELAIDLWSTSLIFNKGHRIRVAVSSSNAPRFEPNPNTGHAFRADKEMRVANNTLHLSEKYPSHIVLPIYKDVSSGRTATGPGQPLPGTKLLTMEGDIASQLVDGVDRFLLRKIDESVERRARYWKRDSSSPEAYNKSIEPNRQHLAHILGVRDPRAPFDGPELMATPSQSALVGRGTGYEVFAVRWPAFGDVHGEGLLLVPSCKKIADVIAIPDADQTPEEFAGLVPGVSAELQFARRLAECGCRVLVPVLIDRKLSRRHAPEAGPAANLTSREFLYRSAFELGQHLIGYEVQKVLAGVDWFAKEAGKEEPKIGVIGYGEGGMLALYAGALDTRIRVVSVGGYFGNRNLIWQQPIDRNVFGLLDEFGDAELASLIIPRRRLIIDLSRGPEFALPSQGGAPATVASPTENEVREEAVRAMDLVRGLKKTNLYSCLWDDPNSKPIESEERSANFVLKHFLEGISDDTVLLGKSHPLPDHLRKRFDPSTRQLRQQHEIDRHNQQLLVESPYVRAKFMSKLDTSSLEKYQKSVEPYREFFAKEVIGQFEDKLLAPNPRSRRAYEGDKWVGYELVLDVFPDVIAYGILLLPKDLKPGEKRPVVVCQHGLEGRPQDVIGEQAYASYKAFAAKLADRGFITFAPQNLYIFHDRFRTLQRKANPLKKTLFSIIVPQHQQITDWLKTLPNVDGNRIAFYGLSYGGKSAMRIPPLVSNYCLSICSADFNEWVWKNASTRSPYSYAWLGEYEIFEFDLGSTFNYAEMAALIAPRPFMVERGHFDGVAPDETVGYEFAKVRHLYEARLGLGDRCAIEWFVGPHTINETGTFAFLHKHLVWPKR